MSESLAAGKSDRLLSLDVFRGITIAGMVMVNNPGTWGAMYQPLGHASWHGWTPTDFIFPFFLFIVGVAMTFSFDKRLARGDSRVELFAQVVRRALILFLLGMILQSYPNFRLNGPYILIIAALGVFFAHTPVFDFREIHASVAKTVAIVLMLGAAAWIVVDFDHFNSRASTSSWQFLWPSHTLSADKQSVVGFRETIPLGQFKADAIASGATAEQAEAMVPPSANVVRVPGVLQRIALCYLFASVIMMCCGVRGRVVWTAVLLLGYWAVMRFVDPPKGFIFPGGGLEGMRTSAPEGDLFRGALNDWIDIKLVGWHLYAERPDPEGFLSTVPAIGTTLLGILTGTWLHQPKEKIEKCAGMFYAGAILLAAGYMWGLGFPPNKKIWTSSYVLLMGGFALNFLAFCFYLIDIKGVKKWAWPFIVFGTNAIFVFFASGILARTWAAFKWVRDADAGTMWSVQSWIYANIFQKPLGPESWIDTHLPVLGGEKLSSFAYALCYIAMWLGLTYPLYRKKIFFKV